MNPGNDSGTRLITAIIASDLGHSLLERLDREFRVHTALLHRARGVGVVSILRGLKFGAREEWDVLEVMVPGERADEVFTWLYEEAGIDQPHGGFIYMASPYRAVSSARPRVPENPAPA